MPTLRVGQEKATKVVSNQYLFDNVTPLADLGGLTEFQYIESHWIYTDHTQFVTGVRRACPICGSGTRFSTDMIYWLGLAHRRCQYRQRSALCAVQRRDLARIRMPDGKPLTVRFDVVNLFDTIYQIRSGTGIGVFAPQYGPRRGYFWRFEEALLRLPGPARSDAACAGQLRSGFRP